MPNEEENECAEGYVLSNSISMPLEQFRLWPSYNALRKYTVATYAAGFRNDDYAALRQNVPSAPQLIKYVLACLRDTTPQFATCHLNENWSGLSDDDLFAKYSVSKQNRTNSEVEKTDYFSDGLEVLIPELLTKFEPQIPNSTLSPEILARATHALLITCADQHTSPSMLEPEYAYKLALDDFQFQSVNDASSFIAEWKRANCESVFVRTKSSGDSLVSMSIPLDDESYKYLMAGRLDIHEIAGRPIPKASNKIAIFSIAGDSRIVQARARRKAQRELHSMLSAQLSLLALPVLKHGLTLVSFAGTPLSVARLCKNGFRPTGIRTPRTDKELMEMKLGSPAFNLRTNLVYAAFLLYQSIAQFKRKS